MIDPFRTTQERILWALAGTLVTPDQLTAEAVTQTGLFLLRRTARMPDFLRPPTRLATLGFGLGSVLLYGRPFFALNFPQRKAYVSVWAFSPLSPMRDYIRLVSSLITLRAYES